MHIGPYALANRVFAAPMAGVTDRPFRRLCKALGAGYAVSEMVTSRRDLWDSLKTSRRADHQGEVAPIAVRVGRTGFLEQLDDRQRFLHKYHGKLQRSAAHSSSSPSL
jgi:tRNA-dihydrouridine synthase